MEIYLKWEGVDVKSLKIKNFEQPGVVAELKSPTGSAVAGIVFSQVPTRLVLDEPKKFKDLISADELDAMWKQKTGTEHHWLLGWAVHEEFARDNRELCSGRTCDERDHRLGVQEPRRDAGNRR